MSKPTNDKDALYTYVLRIADNALITAQRLGEWVGHGPQLEEEMAMANFALDFVGQARMLYSYAAEIDGQGQSEDDLAFLRDSADYYNLLLIEQPNGDFGQTIARQFFYLAFYQFQLRELERSTDERLREIAARASKEVRYQLKHTRQWLVRWSIVAKRKCRPGFSWNRFCLPAFPSIVKRKSVDSSVSSMAS